MRFGSSSVGRLGPQEQQRTSVTFSFTCLLFHSIYRRRRHRTARTISGPGRRPSHRPAGWLAGWMSGCIVSTCSACLMDRESGPCWRKISTLRKWLSPTRHFIGPDGRARRGPRQPSRPPILARRCHHHQDNNNNNNRSPARASWSRAADANQIGPETALGRWSAAGGESRAAGWPQVAIKWQSSPPRLRSDFYCDRLRRQKGPASGGSLNGSSCSMELLFGSGLSCAIGTSCATQPVVAKSLQRAPERFGHLFREGHFNRAPIN